MMVPSGSNVATEAIPSHPPGADNAKPRVPKPPPRRPSIAAAESLRTLLHDACAVHADALMLAKAQSMHRSAPMTVALAAASIAESIQTSASILLEAEALLSAHLTLKRWPHIARVIATHIGGAHAQLSAQAKEAGALSLSVERPALGIKEKAGSIAALVHRCENSLLACESSAMASAAPLELEPEPAEAELSLRIAEAEAELSLRAAKIESLEARLLLIERTVSSKEKAEAVVTPGPVAAMETGEAMVTPGAVAAAVWSIEQGGAVAAAATGEDTLPKSPLPQQEQLGDVPPPPPPPPGRNVVPEISFRRVHFLAQAAIDDAHAIHAVHGRAFSRRTAHTQPPRGGAPALAHHRELADALHALESELAKAEGGAHPAHRR